jgi:hypothetical protein
MDAAAKANVDREIRQLQHDLVREHGSVSSLLRRALILARAKGDSEFQAWAKCELEGEGWAAVPDYRTIHGRTQAWNPFRGWIPVQTNDLRLADSLARRKVESSIPEIETLLDSDKADDGFHVLVPPEGEIALNGMCDLGTPTRFRFVFARGAFDRILVAAKNRLLDWTMQFAVNTDPTTEDDMPFREMMTDTLSLIRNGQLVKAKFRGHVAPNKGTATTFDVDAPIREGDIYVRHLSNGDTEQYEVLEPGFHEAFHGIPASYQSRVQKVTTRPKQVAPPSSITIHGDNARVNYGSVDNSTNTVSKTTVEVWAALDAAIQRVQEPARGQLTKAAAEMKAAHGRPSFLQRYKDFMALTADHLGVLGPVLPLLSNLL